MVQTCKRRLFHLDETGLSAVEKRLEFHCLSLFIISVTGSFFFFCFINYARGESSTDSYNRSERLRE